ncbi:MAG: hypothetical protein SGI83_05480 [Bacteroidota bacterium]|nr:hypothetical protein [Bacteroidota bacterium]
MRKLLIMGLLCTIVCTQSLKAQYYFYNDRYYENAVVIEIGASFGLMNSLTDLGGKKGIGKNFIKDLNWKTAKPSYGIYAMAMYQNKIGLRLEANFGQVNGADSLLKNVKTTTFGRYERNLSFKSRITDFQLALEIHPLMFQNFDDEEPPRLSPYAVLGIGYYSFDPQAKLNGQWYSLQPLRTEGQGFREYPDRVQYNLNQLNIAAGLGVKYEINSMFNAKLEVNHRFLNTDYLDDVSTNYIDPGLFYNYLPVNLAAIAQQLNNRKGELNPSDMTSVGDQRGDPKDNDAFFTIQLKVGMTLGRQRR